MTSEKSPLVWFPFFFSFSLLDPSLPSIEARKKENQLFVYICNMIELLSAYDGKKGEKKSVEGCIAQVSCSFFLLLGFNSKAQLARSGAFQNDVQETSRASQIALILQTVDVFARRQNMNYRRQKKHNLKTERKTLETLRHTSPV